MNCVIENTELSSNEETRSEFNRSKASIKSAEGRIRPVCGLGIAVHQDFYVVVMQEGGDQSQTGTAFPEGIFFALGGQAQKPGKQSRRSL